MKKILLTMMLMLAGIAAWAQNWTAPSANDYESSTPVYVQLNVNGAEQRLLLLLMTIAVLFLMVQKQ